MGKNSRSESIRKIKPALTPEAREKQLIALSIDLAERQLLEGTASSQVITHFLKLGSSKEQLEMKTKQLEQDLIVAKTESLKSSKHIEELYANALEAMSRYSGNISNE